MSRRREKEQKIEPHFSVWSPRQFRWKVVISMQYTIQHINGREIDWFNQYTEIIFTYFFLFIYYDPFFHFFKSVLPNFRLLHYWYFRDNISSNRLEYNTCGNRFYSGAIPTSSQKKCRVGGVRKIITSADVQYYLCWLFTQPMCNIYRIIRS